MQPQPPHHPHPQAHHPHQPLHRFATPFTPQPQQPPAHHHKELTSCNVQGLPSSSAQHPPFLLQPSVHQPQHPQQQTLQQQQPQRRRLNDHQQHLLAAACLGRTSQGDVKLSPLFNTYAEEDREAISAHLLGEKAHRRHAQKQEDERLRSLPQPARKAVPVTQKSRQRKQQPQKAPRSSSSKGGQEDVDAVVGIARPAPLLSPPLSDLSDSSSSSSSSNTIRGSDKMVVVEENRCSSSSTSSSPRPIVVATAHKRVAFDDTVSNKASTAQGSSTPKASSSTVPSVPTRLSNSKRVHSDVDSSHQAAPAAKRLAVSTSSSGWVPPPPIPDSLTYFDLAAHYRKLDAWEEENDPELYVAW